MMDKDNREKEFEFVENDLDEAFREAFEKQNVDDDLEDEFKNKENIDKIIEVLEYFDLVDKLNVADLINNRTEFEEKIRELSEKNEYIEILEKLKCLLDEGYLSSEMYNKICEDVKLNFKKKYNDMRQKKEDKEEKGFKFGATESSSNPNTKKSIPKKRWNRFNSF